MKEDNGYIGKGGYFLAGFFCLFFVGCQVFQKFVFLTVPFGPDSLTHLQALSHPLHIARSLGVLLSLVFLMYPFTIFAQFGPTQVLRTLIVVFFAFFIVFEIGYRSVELFLVQLNWSLLATNITSAEDIRVRFEVFQGVQQAIYFPLLLSHGIGSSIAGWCVPYRGTDRILKVALLLNALRLILRLGGMFGGVQWMNILTGTYYFPLIMIIFIPISAWCFLRGRSAGSDKERTNTGEV